MNKSTSRVNDATTEIDEILQKLNDMVAADTKRAVDEIRESLIDAIHEAESKLKSKFADEEHEELPESKENQTWQP